MQKEKLQPERTCNRHPSRALFRMVENTAMCAECFHQMPVKDRDFELIPEAEFPGAPEHGLLWRALDALKRAPEGHAVKVPANGRHCARIAKSAHQVAQRMGFEIQTRSERGMWIYIRRRQDDAAARPIKISKRKTA